MVASEERDADASVRRPRRFDDLYTQTFPALMAYAMRRCASSADAEDLVAETFTVAWRRLDDVPEGDEARLWLFGTARLVRMAQFRQHSRRRRLLGRLWATRRPEAAIDVMSGHDPAVVAAFNRLRDTDREVLALTLWDGLSAREVGEVLDVSEAAVWKRLERARARLRRLLDDPDGDEADVRPDDPTTPSPSAVRSSP